MGHDNLPVPFFFGLSMSYSRILLIFLAEGDPPLYDAVKVTDGVLHYYY